MENAVKKMRNLVFISIAFMLIQSTLGIATLYTGIMYRNFDRETALEMLDVVKQTDPNFYAKIVNPEDDTYLREFENSYTEKRHPLMIVFGSIMTTCSIGCLVPLVILFLPLTGKIPEGGEESKKKKKESAEDEF